MIARRCVVGCLLGTAGLSLLPARVVLAAGFEITLSEAEWRKRLSPAQYAVLRQHNTERPFTSPLLHEARRGNFACGGCELPLFSSEHEVRQRHWLAQLLGSAWQRRGDAARQRVRHGPHGGALPTLRWAPGPPVRRRPATHRTALLHQRPGTEVHARQGLGPAAALLLVAPDCRMAREMSFAPGYVRRSNSMTRKDARGISTI